MTTTKTEKKANDRKTLTGGLRTLSAQTLEEVSGGRQYLSYTFHEAFIGSY